MPCWKGSAVSWSTGALWKAEKLCVRLHGAERLSYIIWLFLHLWTSNIWGENAFLNGAEWGNNTLLNTLIWGRNQVFAGSEDRKENRSEDPFSLLSYPTVNWGRELVCVSLLNLRADNSFRRREKVPWDWKENRTEALGRPVSIGIGEANYSSS